MTRLNLAGSLSALLFAASVAWSAEPCCIRVVDSENDWPVPLVELRTTHEMRWVTDNAGLIALDAPELMHREVWFDVVGHGYEVPKDGFDMRGVRLRPEPGKTLAVKVNRTQLAKRLGRMTGAGLFAESQKLGADRTWPESGVAGCDSVQTTEYRGRRFWLWGDTKVLNYPLGVFHSTGATTDIHPLTSFKPPLRMTFDYFRRPNGAPSAIATMPGDGPTWISGLVSLPDSLGNVRLVASYMKLKPPLDVYQWGLCVWNDEAATFDSLRVIWTRSVSSDKPPPRPDGHATRYTDDDGRQWVLFGNPLPDLRCPATFEAWQDQSQWEVLHPQETLVSAADATPVKPHSGSIGWSPWRRRWITVFVQAFGSPSVFGEVWYAESEAPSGPWGPAVKIMTHDNYTFYNPRLHVDFVGAEPVALFEGTYTSTFADRPPPTPRYDYNQVLYLLSLDDAKLHSGSKP